MTDAPAVGAPPPAPPRLLSLWGTALCTVALLVLGVWLLRPGDPLQALDRPVEDLERAVGREMDLRAALAWSAGWERVVYAAMLASDEASRDAAIRWYDELVDAEGAPLAALQRLVLLAEAGRAERVAAALADWAPADPAGVRYRAWAEGAYGPDPVDRGAVGVLLADARAALPAGWFADRLVERLAARAGDATAVAAAEAATLARGGRLLARHRVVLLAEALLVGLGLAALAWRRPGMRVGTAPLPPPWGVADGWGLFVRGALGLVAIGVVSGVLSAGRSWAVVLLSLASGVPLLAWAAWYARARGEPARRTFGLEPRPGSGPALVRVTLVLTAVSTLADAGIELAASLAGVDSHWADGFMEGLLWGSPGDVLAESADAVLWAPAIEEPLFRGVLYPTLRLRTGPWPAALGSAAVFALAHGYGAVGLASVLGSGVLWAWAYEQTRSLWPGILAHGMSNVLATAIFLVTLRW